MTGDKELPEGEIFETGGDVDGPVGPSWFWNRSDHRPAVKKPTWRTFGSMTRDGRRGSIFRSEIPFPWLV